MKNLPLRVFDDVCLVESDPRAPTLRSIDECKKLGVISVYIYRATVGDKMTQDQRTFPKAGSEEALTLQEKEVQKGGNLSHTIRSVDPLILITSIGSHRD